MILKSQYHGNYTYCGTYAIYDLIQSNLKISMNKFEIITSVPFGIVHNPDYPHRIISPYVDPTIGLNKAAKILNIDLKTYQSDEKEEMYSKLVECIQKGAVLIGPVNMAKLNYLPQPRIYNKVPHYIVLYKLKNNKFFLNDSEGLIGYYINKDELMDIWNGHDIYEAKKLFNMRTIENYGKEPNEEQLVMKSIINCQTNLLNACKEGQGPYVFLKLWDMIKNTGKKYYNYIFFDLEIFIQRKYLLMEIIEWANDIIKSEDCESIKRIAMKQMKVVSNINYNIRNKQKLVEGSFKQLYDLEKQLTALFHKNILIKEVEQ
ncbi:hypothetical protein [Vallitalea sp.]|jgi:hypothetical protein|uniref:hypothetical protein n=1 Tax=Vallitalea sp. TaxID=1882829 RepID=UPI0025E98C99|nr:hypothetical protein [Vallitalea sp.]MCT4688881.1 hypothetical protein [Vallitalea sp.]